MASSDDRLRRSKRNKFHLDVTALNSANPDRRKTLQPSRVSSPLTGEPGPSNRRAASESPPNTDTGPSTGPSSASPVPDDDGKRSRRQNRNTNFVYDDESEEDPDIRHAGMVGTHFCSRCPSRFETRPGLANHFKLHGERRHNCEQCDFSCGSTKAIRNHRRCHGIKKNQSPSPTNSDTRSDSSAPSPAPPQLVAASADEPSSSSSGHLGSPPELSAAVPVPRTNKRRSTPVIEKHNVKKPEVRRNRCAMCPFICRNRRRFEKHVDGHSRGTGFRCHRCTLTTPSSGFLKRHITEVHKETNFPWPPKYMVDGLERGNKEVSPARIKSSNKSIRGKRLLREFVSNMHKNDLRGNMSCPIQGCHYACTTEAQLVMHKRRSHPYKRRGRFSCIRCGISMPSIAALRIHKEKNHKRRLLDKHDKELLFNEALGNRVYLVHHHGQPAPVVVAVEEESAPSSGQATPTTSQASTSQPSPSSASSPFTGIQLPEYLRTIVAEMAEAPREPEQVFPFKCSDCPFGTTARNKLDRHQSKHHVKSDLQCPLCTFSCRGEDIMQQHFRLHLSFPKEASPPTMGDLVRYLQVQQGCGRPIVQPAMSMGQALIAQGMSVKKALTSGMSVKTALMIQGVIGKKSPPTKPQPAVPVKETTQSKPRTPYVALVLDDGTKVRQCLECPYMTKHACDLTTHVHMHISDAKRHQCAQCSYSTKRMVSMKVHFEQHQKENEKHASNGVKQVRANGIAIGSLRGAGRRRTFHCRWCPWATFKLTALWQHNRSHIYPQNAVIRCSVCSYYGYSMELMEDHILMHDINKDSPAPIIQRVPPNANYRNKPVFQTYMCSLCPFTASAYRPIWEHRKLHGAGMKQQCGSCTYSCKSKRVLRRHEKLHRELPPTSPAPSYGSTSPAPILEREEPYGDVMEPLTLQINDDEKRQSNSAPPATSNEFEGKRRTRKGNSKEPKIEEIKKEEPDVIEKKDIKEDPDAPLNDYVIALLRPDEGLRFMLAKEMEPVDNKSCSDCPFADPDACVMELHRDCHSLPPRPQKCDLCSYSCHTAESLHMHISLHLPALSPNSAAAQKKKPLVRRRTAPAEIIPPGAPHFTCPKCAFKTMTRDCFDEHMYGHAQDLQRRLVTTMKRTAVHSAEGNRVKSIGRVPKKTDTFHCCDMCSFRCETITAFSRHYEMHKTKGIYKCRMCSYEANTKSITLFHENNHHSDHTISNIRKSAILAPQAIHLPVKASPQEIQQLAGRVFTCKKCEGFSCYELSALHGHWQQLHNDTEQEKEMTLYLSMDMVPKNSIVTIA